MDWRPLDLKFHTLAGWWMSWLLTVVVGPFVVAHSGDLIIDPNEPGLPGNAHQVAMANGVIWGSGVVGLVGIIFISIVLVVRVRKNRAIERGPVPPGLCRWLSVGLMIVSMAGLMVAGIAVFIAVFISAGHFHYYH